MNKFILIISFFAIPLLTVSLSVKAEERFKNFPAHHEVPQKDYHFYVKQLDGEDKLELREYLDYEEREPCQQYQQRPMAFIKDECDLGIKNKRDIKKRVVYVAPPALEIIQEYEVYFDFDRSLIEPTERAVLDRVARDIATYNPAMVTIVGHTDRSGPQDYNYELSMRRARAVSEELTRMGIQNSVLDNNGMGEMNPAIETGDGVKLRQNRRATIQFRK